MDRPFKIMNRTKKGGELLGCPITGGLEALKKGQKAVWLTENKVTKNYAFENRLWLMLILLIIISRFEASPRCKLQLCHVHCT